MHFVRYSPFLQQKRSPYKKIFALWPSHTDLASKRTVSKLNASSNNFENGESKEKVVSITYEEIGLFPRSFNRVFDRFLKQIFSDVENLVLQEYRFYRYLFLTTLKTLFLLFFVPFLVNLIAKNYFIRPLTEYFWNSKQPEIFLNAYQQKRAFTELQEFEETLFFESLISSPKQQNESKNKDNILDVTMNSPLLGTTFTSTDNFENTQGSISVSPVKVYKPTKSQGLGDPYLESEQPQQILQANLKVPQQAIEQATKGLKEERKEEFKVLIPLGTSSPNSEVFNPSYLNSYEPGFSTKLISNNSNTRNFNESNKLGNLANSIKDSNSQYSKNNLVLNTNNLELTGVSQNLNSKEAYSFQIDFINNSKAYTGNPTELDYNYGYWPMDRSSAPGTLAESNKNSVIELIKQNENKELNLPQPSLEYPSESSSEKLQQKTLKLAIWYNKNSIEAITNILSDFLSFLTLIYLLISLEIQINVTKSFLLEVFFGLEDSKKSLLILLITDLLVGYHSPNLWEFFFEFIFNHYGIPESQTVIFLLVATLPVLLDVLFKYLIFRHLNRSSPATVATYHAMIE